MSGTEGFKIPKYLYRPYQVLFFDSEDLGFVFFFLLLGFLFGGVFWLVGIILSYVVLKAKRKKPRGYIKHLCYLLGFYNFKNCPSVFEKRFFE